MLTFEYTAKDDKTGKTIKAQVQAQSQQAAVKLIATQGYSPTSIHSVGEGGGLFSRRSTKIRTKDRVLFARQLSTLINAGLPLTQSLRTVSEQTQSRALNTIINTVITDVEGGTAFATALSRHPRVFNKVFTSLIAAGETSGTLDKALERIAHQQEKDAEVVSKVRGALVYPGIVLIVILMVVVFMLTTVLPQVELLYEDLNQSLPFITAAMLTVSRFIIGFWWLILAGVFGLVYFGYRYVQTTGGRSVVDKIKMEIPLFGKLFRKLYMARFSRTGSTLMGTGVPMLDMLRITAESVNNVHVEAATVAAAEKVKGGKALSDSLEPHQEFLPLVPQMIRIGEQSGAIDAMMAKAAEFYEKELDNEIKTISTTIEPALMVVLAITAGLMVGAILIPVYGLVGESIAL
ncbi:MAG: type II secretion system F family protein [Candidatus Saccharimonadales bacterium]|nr:type II secretion system F family protein [Candidatus Saccharimonadales bacterium]